MQLRGMGFGRLVSLLERSLADVERLQRIGYIGQMKEHFQPEHRVLAKLSILPAYEQRGWKM